MITPSTFSPRAWAARMAWETTGVGVARSPRARTTGIPLPAKTSTAVSVAQSEVYRTSLPMTTGPGGRPRRLTAGSSEVAGPKVPRARRRSSPP